MITGRPAINSLGIELAMSHAEIAEVMTLRGEPMTRRQVQYHEVNAIRKLAQHPEIQELAARLWDEG